MQASLKEEIVMLLTVKRQKYESILKKIYLVIEHAQFA